MYYLTILEGEYLLADGQSIGTVLEPLMRIIYSGNFTQLVHFHLSEDEVSIIFPIQYAKDFKDIFYTPPYKGIRVETDNPGLEESGILARLTAIFQEYDISILSISTYRYNYIFVPCADIEMVRRWLRRLMIYLF